MASPPPPPPPPPSFFFFSFLERRRPFRSVIIDYWRPEGSIQDDAFVFARHKDPNQRTLKACSKGSEQDDKKDGRGDSTSPDDERPKHSHECILQMNRSWAMPPRLTTSSFILDSGATCHVVADVSLFSPAFVRSRTPATTPPAANAAAAAYHQAHDGRVLAVAGVGTISCDNFHIPNVQCVPDLCTGLNLVSVHQLAECDYLVMFGGGQCSVMDGSSGRIVGKGRLHGDDGLYHLEFLHIPHH